MQAWFSAHDGGGVLRASFPAFFLAQLKRKIVCDERY
jgi:hypothetical protein